MLPQILDWRRRLTKGQKSFTIRMNNNSNMHKCSIIISKCANQLGDQTQENVHILQSSQFFQSGNESLVKCRAFIDG